MKILLPILCCIFIVGKSFGHFHLTDGNTTDAAAESTTAIDRIYVNALATGNNDGSSWQHAFTDLNDALALLTTFPAEQIWIAEGTYKPTTCLNCNGSANPRDYTFFIPIDNVILYGGFPNTGTPDWDDWDIEAFPTVLSGNIGNPNTPTDNCHHVVTSDHEVHLNGLTICDGYTEGSGAGIYAADLRLTSCWVKNNTALGEGGGIYIIDGSPKLLYSRFTNNHAQSGGAVKTGDDSSIEFFNCIFENNSAVEYGGAVSIDLSQVNIHGANSLFYNNTAGISGGAISGADPFLSNCSFVENGADEHGSSIYFGSESNVDPKLYNCIFWNNLSDGDAFPIETSSTGETIELQNTLTESMNCADLGASVLCMEGNIFDADNPFISITNQNFKLHPTSQAINAGANEAILFTGYPDLSGNSRILEDVVDMGAYEFGNCQFNFTTQTEIDNFATNYPGLTEVNCNLYIKSGSNDPITNLEGLSQITIINGYLWIDKCGNLNSLQGLHHVEEVGEYVKIEVNRGLIDLQGLNSLTTIGGYCKFGFNYNMETLDGVNNLSTIGGYLKIEKDTSLTDISALANLSSIGGYLSIRKNKVLTNFNGLENLSSINGYLEIATNPLLTDISGLNNLNTSGIALVEIFDNPSLAVCHEPMICAYINLGTETPFISNNDTGCNDLAEIENFCTYPDNDGDGFTIVEDCDDNNPLVNPNATEIPYNGIDDDCNNTTPDDDLDGDGLLQAFDCDDTNPLLGGVEIPYNGLDDDCNIMTLDDDLDLDGFPLASDCDDTNPLVNTGVTEIPYNGINDDCNPNTPDDDFDLDGFGIAEDCDDQNASINPFAVEIPNNGIDEDCDGVDLIISGTDDLLTIKPRVFPNPTAGVVQISFSIKIEGTYELRDVSGKLLLEGSVGQETVVDLGAQAQGVYVLLVKTGEGVWAERVVRM